MGRPRKDPSLPVKAKAFATVKLPVRPGRVVVIRYPIGGLTFDECRFVREYLPLLMEDGADQEELDELRED